MAPFPLLYQVNTRIWLGELGRALGRPATLDDVPDADLDRLAARGFDWLYLLGTWATGPAGREVSRTHQPWQLEYQQILPDATAADVSGSPFAVHRYEAAADLGGDPALARFRARLRARGLRLLLDFVPNHTALDHPWVEQHPEYFVRGTAQRLLQEPHNYTQRHTARGPLTLAHGRDPYFPGWPDTLQLNYRHAGLRRAMVEELIAVAGKCDGVRCDMAMLLLPDVFTRTWDGLADPADGSPPQDAPFWPDAIAAVRARHPGFLFMAEVYWDLEWTLQQQGFDYTYDKRLYDRLHARDPEAVRKHLWADAEYQRKSVRFLENHDEPRAASAFPPHVHKAAATVAYLVPGLRFLHEGQLEGRRVRANLHLARRPAEPPDPDLEGFYERLLACLRRPEVKAGSWKLLESRPAWDGNPTWEKFLAFRWTGGDGRRLLVTVNYGPTQGQCYLPLHCPDVRGKAWVLRDLLSPAVYERDGDSMADHGLYLDVPEWGRHVFEMVAK